MKSSGSRATLQEQSSPTATQKLLACLSYGTVSVSITLFNKAVFSVYGFHYPNFVTTLQILVSILYMHLLKGIGAFRFAPLTLKGARQVCSIPAVHTPSLQSTPQQGINRLVLCPDLAIGVLLVAVRCFGGDCFAILDSANVQVSTVVVLHCSAR